MARRAGYVLLGLAALLAGCRGRPKPPDILLIVIDTVRADALSSYGSLLPTTPFLDRLSRKGTLMANVQSQAPWTKPSIASLFTGLTPREHGVRKGTRKEIDAGLGVDAMPPGLPTIATALAAAGYRTEAFQTNPHLGHEVGFDQGFGIYRERFFAKAGAVAAAARKIVLQPEEKSVFLYLHLMDPHTPYTPGLWPDPETRPRPVALEELIDADREGTEEDRHRIRLAALPAYLSEVMRADRGVGMILRSLRHSTVVAVTADHGEEFLEHGGFEHGHTLYQELLHVPLILSGPGIEAGLLDSRLLPLMDLYRRLLSAAKIRTGPSPAGELVTSEALLWGDDRIAARRGRYKVIAHLPDATEARGYDLLVDPMEQHPVATAETQAIEQELREFMANHPAAPAGPGRKPGDKTLDALEKLGYLGDRGAGKGDADP